MSLNGAALVLCSCLIICQVVNGWHNPETAPFAKQLILEDTFEWFKLEPTALKLTYDETRLMGKLTFNLFGYSERNSTKISKVQTPFTLLASVELPAASNGEVDVLSLGLKCRTTPADCNRYDMGFVQIAMGKTENETHGLTMDSQIIPLGWFSNPRFVSEGFATWPFGKCKTWFSSEKEELKKAMGNTSCPNTMDAAMSDPGWFLRSNYLAGFPSNDRKTGNSTAQPAQRCFYSAISDIPANMFAAPASLCCYRLSDSALLQKEFMSPENPRLHGSSVLRSHPYGSDYHQEHYLPGQVPYLSHWYWDKLPYLYCCYWWKGSTCADFYLKLRPPPPMKPKPSGSRAAYVHGSDIRPFSGAAPTVCSDIGEYWLIKSPAIGVQIRNYVVSSYTGSLPATWPHRSDFKVAGSKTPFVTGIAVRSMQAPDVGVELICPDGEFRSYFQATYNSSQRSEAYDNNMGLGVGTKILVGESIKSDNNKIYSVLVKHGNSRVGVYGYVAVPGEELMNLYITMTGDLFENVTGLATGSSCADSKVTVLEERIFSSICDNCEDFLKFRDGRPLYYEEVENPKAIPETTGIPCNGDKTCLYVAWSTHNYPYYQAIAESKVAYIDKLLTKINNTGWEVCQKPDIQGLFVSQDQNYEIANSMTLKCMDPYSSSAEGTTAICAKTGEKLAFNYPSGFVCAEPTVVKAEEVKATAADEEYTKKHYTPEASDASTASSEVLSPQVALLGIAFVLAELFRAY